MSAYRKVFRATEFPLVAGERLRQPLLRLSLLRRIELRLDGGLNLRKIGFALVSSED